MKYLVKVPEIHISTMLVEAKTPMAARRAVSAGEGTELRCEFKETRDDIDVEEWAVESAEYVIKNTLNGLFWSNDSGWGDLAAATVFSGEEQRRFDLPTDGCWQVWGQSLMDHDTPSHYEFDTLAELNAFLKGTDEANGWMDMHQFDSQADAEQFLKDWSENDGEMPDEDISCPVNDPSCEGGDDQCHDACEPAEHAPESKQGKAGAR